MTTDIDMSRSTTVVHKEVHYLTVQLILYYDEIIVADTREESNSSHVKHNRLSQKPRMDCMRLGLGWLNGEGVN